MCALFDPLLRARSRRVWRDPVRKILTLESFARTEADGGRDIGSAAGKVSDAELRAHLERHTADELRHAELFRRRAEELRAATPLPPELDHEADDSTYDLSRGRPATEVDAHGFFTAGLLDEMGEVAYVAMLHAAERRAARIFAVHHDCNRDDPGTAAVFAEILRDEKYHVAYTRTILDKWTEQGRGREVSAARSAARGGRLWSAWKRTGVRAGANFSRVVLQALYFTLLLPFGLFAKPRDTSGWRPPRTPAGARPADRALRGQG